MFGFDSPISRIVGVASGIFNSPYAFVWGAMSGEKANAEKWDKMGPGERVATAVGTAIGSAKESMTEKGAWGYERKDYYEQRLGKKYRNAKDWLPFLIDDIATMQAETEEAYGDELRMLGVDPTPYVPPEKASKLRNWLKSKKVLNFIGPAIDTTLDLISDPALILPEAVSLAELRVPKHFIKKVDPKIIKEITKLESLEKDQKAILQARLLWDIKERAKYKVWQDNMFKDLANGKVDYLLPEGQGSKLMDGVHEVINGKPSSYIEGVPAGPKTKISTAAVEKAKELGRVSTTDRRIAETKRLWNETFETLRRGNTKFNSIDDVTADAHFFPNGNDPINQGRLFTQQEQVNDMRKWEMHYRKGASDLEKQGKLEESMIAAHQAQFHREAAEEGEKALKALQIERFNIPKPPTKVKPKSTFKTQLKNLKDESGLAHINVAAPIAGAAFGIEKDEEGHYRYNFAKGIAGAVGGAVIARSISTGLAGKNVIPYKDLLKKNRNWGKIAGMTAKPEKKTLLSFTTSGVFARAKEKAFDLVLDRFMTLKKKGGSVDAYNKAITFSSHKEQISSAFRTLKKRLQPIRHLEVEFSHYINAKRAWQRAKLGIKNPNNVTVREAADAMAEILENIKSRGENVKEFLTSVDEFQKWLHDEILKPSLDNGIINKKMYDAMKDKFYVTFEILDNMPDMDKFAFVDIAPEYFSLPNQKIFYRMKGTEKKLGDTIESTIKKFITAKGTIARNRVASTLIEGLPESEKVIVARSKKHFWKLKNAGKSVTLKAKAPGLDTVSYFKDGRVQKYLIDEDLARAMKQLNPKQAPKVVHALNAIFRKTATTAYLPFTVRNAFRDAFMAYNTAPVFGGGKTGFLRDVPVFFKEWIKGAVEGIKHEFLGSSNIIKEYIKSGGGFGFVGEFRLSKAARSSLFVPKPGIKQVLKAGGKVIKSPLDFIEKISSVVELAPRVAVYNVAKFRGKTLSEAAILARQSTIDFNRGGRWLKYVNQWIPFINARFQGRLTVARAVLKDPKRTFPKLFTSVVLPGAATYAWNRVHYDKYYDDIPEPIKQNYFNFIYGTTKDDKGRIVPKYLSISKGDVGQIVWNPLEYALDKAMDKDPEKGLKFLINYMSDVSPIEFAREGELSGTKALSSITPPFIKGVIENTTNLNFWTGNEIVPWYMSRNKPDELIYKSNTPESYKKMSLFFAKHLDWHWSPLMIQNLASDLFAGYGREGMSLEAIKRNLKGTIIRTYGGGKERKAWIVIKDIENGYISSVGWAAELAKKGKVMEAIKLMQNWNKNLSKQIKEYNKTYDGPLRDRGGLHKSYFVTPEKMRNIIKSGRIRNKRSAIQKKLTGRR
ncbi:MAG: LPD38 domain-containing protein [bacterium]